MLAKALAALAPLAIFVGKVLAVAEVTAVPLTGGCSSYPGYDAATGIAGPWTIQVVNSGNTSIEGFSDTVKISRGATGIRWGYITFPTRNDIAKTPLQCASNQLQGRVPTGVSGYSWQPLVIAPYPYDASLIYGVNGSSVIPFEHYDVDTGVKQDGVYLGGYQNSTTWGLRYEPKANIDGNPFFYARFLGPGSQDPSSGDALFDGEFTAFIKTSSMAGVFLMMQS